MVEPIRNEDVVTAAAKFVDKIRSDGTQAASNKYVFVWHVISVVKVYHLLIGGWPFGRPKL